MPKDEVNWNSHPMEHGLKGWDVACHGKRKMPLPTCPFWTHRNLYSKEGSTPPELKVNMYYIHTISLGYYHSMHMRCRVTVVRCLCVWFAFFHTTNTPKRRYGSLQTIELNVGFLVNQPLHKGTEFTSKLREQLSTIMLSLTSARAYFGVSVAGITIVFPTHRYIAHMRILITGC